MGKFLETWNGLNSRIKFAIIALFITIIGFAVVILFIQEEPYEALYTELDANASESIKEYLSLNNIDYQSPEAGTIMVEQKEISNIRMDIASEGILVGSGGGFSLFDQSSIGATKSDKEVQYQRALKGQIEKDLVVAFEDIKGATVTLPLQPEKSIFSSKNTVEYGATVALDLKNGKKLNEEQVITIQNFVASAVLDLKPENVVVTDKTGQLLSELGGEKSNSGSFSKQTEISNEVQSQIHNDLMKYLSKIYGYENVAVTVTTKINFDEIVRNIEKYDPEGTLVSKQEHTENTRKIDGLQIVEPGTDGNGDVPGYDISSEDADATYIQNKEEIIENFEVGKTVETIKKHPELQNINVLVKVNKNLSLNQIDDLQEDMAVAAGLIGVGENGTYENGRVRVSAGAFAQNTTSDPIKDSDLIQEEKTLNTYLNEYKLWIIGLVALILMLIMFFSIMSLFKKAEKERLKLLDEMSLEKEKEETKEQEVEEKKSDKVVLNQLDVQQMAIQTEIEAENQKRIKKSESLKKVANDTAEKNPKQTAEYIKKLLDGR